MCGRYVSTRSATELAAVFDAVDATGAEAPPPDWNVAPTKAVPAVVGRHPRDATGRPDPARTERSVRVMRWGLVPSWAKDPSIGSRMINARAESAAEKPAFRRALATRRCLLPADGWYEWRRGAGGSRPFYVTGVDGAPLALAGLWEFWRRDDRTLVTAAVLTTDAVGPPAEVHSRMPLVLGRRAWPAWLDPDAGAPAELLRPPPVELVAGLAVRPVSTRVNDVRRGGPELTAPLDPVAADEPWTLPLDGPAAADEPRHPR
jgi:putative SOS response-associated peptidase YedK